MLITTGIEKSDGTFCMRVNGKANEGETAKEAITRIAKSFMKKPKKPRWIEKWNRLGDHDNPVEHLPGLFLGKRLFAVATRWENNKWVLIS